MTKEIIGQQAAFLKDYRQRAVLDSSDEEILAEVMAQLTSASTSQYVLPPAKSRQQTTVTFPFDKQVYTQEYDGTIMTRYTYIGEPFEITTASDEQPLW